MSFKKIVIIGPESTGKSTLCRQLAEHYHSHWLPEYAREYLLEHGKGYTISDLRVIATGQMNSEVNLLATLENSCNKNPVFIDTDLYVIKVWSEFVFNSCDNRILDQIVFQNYDLYLLCNTDLPWEKDDLREYPDLDTREKLFHFYKDAMINQNVPWQIISGNYENRLINAITAVNKIL